MVVFRKKNFLKGFFLPFSGDQRERLIFGDGLTGVVLAAAAENPPRLPLVWFLAWAMFLISSISKSVGVSLSLRWLEFAFIGIDHGMSKHLMILRNIDF